MNLGIYKEGQGFWTRLMSFMGWGVIFAWGAAWLWGQVARLPITGVEPQFVQGGVAGVVLIVGFVLCYYLCYNKPSTGEFLIATEGEMKKVNWSSKREIRGSTTVVVSIAVLLGLILFSIDIGFSTFFKWIGVLQSGS